MLAYIIVYFTLGAPQVISTIYFAEKTDCEKYAIRFRLDATCVKVVVPGIKG